MKLKFIVGDRDYITQEADPDDSWDRANTRTEIDSIEVLPRSEDESPRYYETDIDLPVELGDIVYAVVVRYSTGDTFGHDEGQWMIADAFVDELKAREFRDFLNSYNEEPYTWRGRAAVPFSVEFKGKEYRLPWAGYFESLESIDIYELAVGGTKPRGKLRG